MKHMFQLWSDPGLGAGFGVSSSGVQYLTRIVSQLNYCEKKSRHDHPYGETTYVRRVELLVIVHTVLSLI